MERRGSNTWLVAVLAIAVGFLAALLIFGAGDSKNTSATVSNDTTVATTTTGTTTTGTTVPGTTTSTTTTAPAQPAPQSPAATVPGCIALWNQTNNRGPQTFLINEASRQPVRVHVGATAAVPPECLITIVANDGSAYVYPEGGGTTFPYAPTAGPVQSSTLPASQKTSNALEQRDGTLKER